MSWRIPDEAPWETPKEEPSVNPINTKDRHPNTQQITRWFGFGHLPKGPARDTSAFCADLAARMIVELSDGPELTAGLRKLLEAKDCFVRAAIAGEE